MIINEKTREGKKATALLRKRAEKLGRTGKSPWGSELKIGDTVYTIISQPNRSPGKRLDVHKEYTIAGFAKSGYLDVQPEIKSIPHNQDDYAVDVGLTAPTCMLNADCLFLSEEDAIYAGYLLERSEFEQEYGDAGAAIIDEFCLGRLDVAYDMMKMLSRVKSGLTHED
jgi:hypothetical protein